MLGSVIPTWWGTSYQYNAFLVVVLVCAAVDGAARLARSPLLARRRAADLSTVGLVCATAMCAVALFLVPLFAFGPALHPSFYRRDARMNAAAAAVAAVPSGVTVEAVNHLGPQLSARDVVLLWDGDGSSPLRPPWVVADIAKKEFTFASRGQQVRRVALLKRSGYQIVFSRDGYLVMHRSDARQAAG